MHISPYLVLKRVKYFYYCEKGEKIHMFNSGFFLNILIFGPVLLWNFSKIRIPYLKIISFQHFQENVWEKKYKNNSSWKKHTLTCSIELRNFSLKKCKILFQLCTVKIHKISLVWPQWIKCTFRKHCAMSQ